MDFWRLRHGEHRLPHKDNRSTGMEDVPTGLSSEQSRWSWPVVMGPLRQPPEDSDSLPPIWAQRLSLAIFVVFCVELGMLLTVLPWTRVWTENSILLAHPDLRVFLTRNFVRGAVTGLGVVDIWLGIWEVVHYRERKPVR